MIHARHLCFPKLLWLTVYLLDRYRSVDLFSCLKRSFGWLKFLEDVPVACLPLSHTHAQTIEQLWLTLCAIEHSSRGWLGFIYLFEVRKRMWKDLFMSRQSKGHSPDRARVIPQCWYCKGRRCLISPAGSSNQPAIDPFSDGILRQQKKTVINMKRVTDSCTWLKDAL